MCAHTPISRLFTKTHPSNSPPASFSVTTPGFCVGPSVCGSAPSTQNIGQAVLLEMECSGVRGAASGTELQGQRRSRPNRGGGIKRQL